MWEFACPVGRLAHSLRVFFCVFDDTGAFATFQFQRKPNDLQSSHLGDRPLGCLHFRSIQTCLPHSNRWKTYCRPFATASNLWVIWERKFLWRPHISLIWYSWRRPTELSKPKPGFRYRCEKLEQIFWSRVQTVAHCINALPAHLVAQHLVAPISLLLYLTKRPLGKVVWPDSF